MFETQTSEADYAVNLERVESIAYLSKKEINSNINSPQCLNHKCRTFPIETLDPTEETIPFTIKLEPLESTEYENVNGDKESIKLDFNLV